MADNGEQIKVDWESTEKPLKMQQQNNRNGQRDIDYTCKLSDAFDNYFACLTVGKQMSNYYRYGEKRSCKKPWQRVKLCMRVKMASEEDGRKIMREHNAKQDAERAAQPNVLDVWAPRTPDNPAYPQQSGNDDAF
ncbi:hypothetical protein IWW48_001737 [Coemansia sp. RSA 1200]|nr:hypothetical protein IWW48_001737 [Coemansia sp. RSA 1200]